MTEPEERDDKVSALRHQHALNPRPDRVRDPAFTGDNPFFDAQDLVQVKYEMLRRVREDGQRVSQASATFGFSRPSFYEAQAAFERVGPARSGAPAARAAAGPQALGGGPRRARGGVERAAPSHQQRPRAPRRGALFAERASTQRRAGAAEATKRGAAERPDDHRRRRRSGSPGYEALRTQALSAVPAATPRGLSVLTRAGLAAWMRALAPTGRAQGDGAPGRGPRVGRL